MLVLTVSDGSGTEITLASQLQIDPGRGSVTGDGENRPRTSTVMFRGE
jgi:hypothetical protein